MKDLLTIGSVVTLEEATKKLMIIGIVAENTDDNTVYDYMAVPFPEGYMDPETMFLFNHEDIETVNFLGFVDADTQLYRAELASILDGEVEPIEVEEE